MKNDEWKYEENTGYFVFFHSNGGYEHDVNLSHIHNENDLKIWVDHLSEKRWINPGSIEAFKKIALKHMRFQVAA